MTGPGRASGVAVEGLAVYRLARLIARDRVLAEQRSKVIGWVYRREGRASGPYEITGRPGSTWEDAADADEDPPKAVAGLRCVWCVSVWCAAGLGVAGWVWPGGARVLARGLAVCAVAGGVGDVLGLVEARSTAER